MGSEKYDRIRKKVDEPGFADSRVKQMRLLKLIRRSYTVDKEWDALLNECVAAIQYTVPHLPWCKDDAALHKVLKTGNKGIEQSVPMKEMGNFKRTVRDEDKMYMKLPRSSFLRRYVEWADTGNAPLAFYFWTGVALLAAACRRNVFFVHSKRTYLSQYIILAGMRASGKGQAMDPMLSLMGGVKRELERRAEEMEAKGNLEHSYDFLDARINKLESDITPEAMVSALHDQQVARVYHAGSGEKEEDKMRYALDNGIKVNDATGFLVLDELATFFGKDNHNHSKKPVFLTEIKEADTYSKRTQYKGTQELKNVAVTMIAGSAPDWFSTAIDRTLMGGGFMDRTIWVYRDPDIKLQLQRSQVSTQPPNYQQGKRLEEWLIDCLLLLPEETEVCMEDDVAEYVHNDVWRRMVQAQADRFKVFKLDDEHTSANRQLNSVLQLATLLAVSDDGRAVKMGEAMVKREHIDLAVEIIEVEATSFTRVMEDGTRSFESRRDAMVLGKIEENGGCFMHGKLYKKIHKKKEIGNATVFNEVIHNLKVAGDIHEVGHHKTKYYLTAAHNRAGGCDTCNEKEKE